MKKRFFRPNCLLDIHAKVWVATIAVAVFLLFFILRYDNIFNRPLLSHNEDATGHVLATLHAIEKAPIQVHRYLPLITMSQNTGDMGVDNFVGASIADNRGNRFYVSFPPLGFAVPSIIFTTIGIEPTLLHLRLFSLALGLASTILLYFLAFEVSKDVPLPRHLQRAGSLCVALLFFVNSETLWIFANIYWHQVLLQPILIGALLLLVRFLREPTSLRAVIFAVTVFATCLVEWSGFTFALGVMASGAYLASRRERAGILLIGAGAGASIAALSLILWHFSQVAGLEAYIRTLAERPQGHLLGLDFLKDGIVVFSIMYGPLLLVGLLFRLGSKSPQVIFPTDWISRARIVLFCTAASCAESILLLHHSVWYTYGSLPIMTLVLLLILFVILKSAPSLKLLVVGTMIFSLVSAVVYRLQNPPDLLTTPFAAQYLNLDTISNVADKDETIFVNFVWPLGVELARTGRNLVAPNVLGVATASSITLDQLQGYIRMNSHAKKGKVFIFEARNETVYAPVWWHNTKSAVFTSPSERIGQLDAVVSFDLHGITGFSVRNTIKKSLTDETNTVLRTGINSASLLNSLLVNTVVDCPSDVDQPFIQCAILVNLDGTPTGSR